MACDKHNTAKGFEGVCTAFEDTLEALKKGQKLTTREVILPDRPAGITARDIIKLRQNELKISQRLFAAVLNVSPRTVQAWEQNINSPSGPALRLLWLAKQNPRLFLSIFAEDNGRARKKASVG